MSEPRHRFVAALKRHETSGRLREAFERCNEELGDNAYDRTTLNRWLDGSIPNRGEFVRCLAERLDDPELHEAWVAAHNAPRGATGPQAVIESFQRLDPDDRLTAFRQIRPLFLERFPEVRRRLTYRVEVTDAADPDADHLELRMDLEWDGGLPQNAVVAYVSDHSNLGPAYEEPRCIFREALAFTPERLGVLLESWPDQVLVYNTIGDANQRMERYTAVAQSEGVFAFDNQEVAEGRIRLSLAYPYPKGFGLFMVRFGQYRVVDGAEFTLALSSRSTSSPGAFPFLPAGRQREYATEALRPNELVVTLGTGGTTLSEGDGVVLHWTEG